MQLSVLNWMHTDSARGWVPMDLASLITQYTLVLTLQITYAPRCSFYLLYIHYMLKTPCNMTWLARTQNHVLCSASASPSTYQPSKWLTNSREKTLRLLRKLSMVSRKSSVALRSFGKARSMLKPIWLIWQLPADTARSRSSMRVDRFWSSLICQHFRTFSHQETYFFISSASVGGSASGTLLLESGVLNPWLAEGSVVAGATEMVAKSCGLSRRHWMVLSSKSSWVRLEKSAGSTACEKS